MAYYISPWVIKIYLFICDNNIIQIRFNFDANNIVSFQLFKFTITLNYFYLNCLTTVWIGWTLRNEHGSV